VEGPADGGGNEGALLAGCRVLLVLGLWWWGREGEDGGRAGQQQHISMLPCCIIQTHWQSDYMCDPNLKRV
jgi:hypothetical protein